MTLVSVSLLVLLGVACGPSDTGNAVNLGAQGNQGGDTWVADSGGTVSGNTLAVTASTPAAGSSGFPTNAPISVTFDAALEASSITNANVQIGPTGGAAVARSVSLEGATLVVTPSTDLAAQTSHTLFLGADLVATDGRPLGQDVEITFSTGAAAALIVVSRAPDDGTIASASTQIVVTLSRDVDPATVTDQSFVLTGPEGAVGAEREVAGPTITLTPWSVLESEVDYSVVLTSAISSTTGVSLPDTVTWSFATGQPLQVVTLQPEDGVTRAAITDPIRVTFDQALDTATVTADSFQVRGKGWVDGSYYENEQLPGYFKFFEGDKQVEWWPTTQRLPEYESTIRITLTTDIRSVEGAVLDGYFEFSFETNLLDPSYYYKLRLEGFGDDWALGYYQDGARMLTGSFGPEFDWYVVPLSGEKWGLHNRGRELNGLPKSLQENGTDSKATLVAWNGKAPLQWTFASYGGKPGATKPYESTAVYYMHSNASGDLVLAETGANGLPDLYMTNKSGHIDSLWYFTRADPR